MNADLSHVDTPLGPFTILADPDGAVLASGWTADPADLVPLIHPSLRPTELRERPDLGAATTAATAYFAGDVTAIDDVPVRQHSGEFLRHAWTVLRGIDAGEPVTYAEYAARCGRPAAARAAAQACGRNAAALFVPCHRVLRTGGALGGFRWGLPAKQWLLDFEASCAVPALTGRPSRGPQDCRTRAAPWGSWTPRPSWSSSSSGSAAPRPDWLSACGSGAVSAAPTSRPTTATTGSPWPV